MKRIISIPMAVFMLALAGLLVACGTSENVYDPPGDGDTTELSDKDSDSDSEALADGDTTPDGDLEPSEESEADTPDGDPEPTEETEADNEPDDPDGDGDSPCAPNNCYIDGVCYEAGATPIGNACRYCHPGATKTEWTNRAFGYACAGGTCDGAGACALPDGDLEEAEPEQEPELDYDIDTADIDAGNACQNGMTICGNDTLFTCMNSIWAIAADCFDGAAKATCYDAHCVIPKTGNACTKAGKQCFRQLVFSCEAADSSQPDTLTWKNEEDCLNQGKECWRGACVDPLNTTGYDGCRVGDLACSKVPEYLPSLWGCKKGGISTSWTVLVGPCTCSDGFCQ